ncbi:MAG: twin-arginine translocation signal domain-containing protein, partial [Bacteroidaceae bacterium]|nr:twin-arginine translocation signal domain-containing protein [Bacteroidaceae bacterium]
MNRRDFIKRLGIGAATIGAASIAGCNSKQSNIEAEKGTMPLRLNQNS